MAYQATELQEVFTIKRIVSLHYFEYMSDFSFPGESHNFWEFLYVDKGDLEVTAGGEKLPLKQGEIIFHKPNEFHALAANNVTAPNLVVVSFETEDACMAFFEHKVLTVGENERHLLAQVISEARDTFEGPMDDPYLEQLTRKKDGLFGGEQMIKLHLEQLLIQLYRHFSSSPQYSKSGPDFCSRRITDPANRFPSFPFLSNQDAIFNDILSYLERNITQPLTVEKISRDNLIGVSQLKKLFRKYKGQGVIEYFNQMKINTAKQLIRNQQMNFTQIADFLGYTSVHYFSRQFKNLANMTPSQYRTSILQLAERPEQL